jgi:ribosomal protein S27E
MLVGLNSRVADSLAEAPTLMQKPFLVFRCPKCKNFTNAPAGQKKRRCSYCGHIIDISKAACALFGTPEKASSAVKKFNASRGGDSFLKAVEVSKDRVRDFLPTEKLSIKDVIDKSEEDLPTGKSRRLLELLEREASESACSLDRIAELCPEYQLDWLWVEDQLNKLSNRGTLIFPRPWTVKLVSVSSKEKTKPSPVDVTKEIVDWIQERGGEVEVVDVVKHFEEMGISKESVESSLDRLMNQGVIYRPKTGQIGLV